MPRTPLQSDSAFAVRDFLLNALAEHLAGNDAWVSNAHVVLTGTVKSGHLTALPKTPGERERWLDDVTALVLADKPLQTIVRDGVEALLKEIEEIEKGG